MENQTLEGNPEETPTEPETKVEETQSETPEETPKETVETETPETPKTETVDYEEKFKASQAEAIKLKKQNEELRKAKKEGSTPATDVDAILEVQAATKGLVPEEVAELKNRASILGTSLSEARKDENFALWRKAWKEKVEKEKTLEPSSKTGEGKKPSSLQDKLKSSASLEETEKILTESGLYKSPISRKTGGIDIYKEMVKK